MHQQKRRSPREDLPWNQPDTPPRRRATGLVPILLVLALIALRFGIAGPLAPLDTRGAALLQPPPRTQAPPSTAEPTADAPLPTPQATDTPRVEPTPETFRLAIARDAYEALEGAITQLADERHTLIILPYADAAPIETVLAKGLADGAVFWSVEPVADALVLREEPYVAVFHPALERDFTRKQLADLAAGHDQTYRIVAPVGRPLVAELFGLGYLGEADINWYPTEADDWAAAKEYVATHEDAWAVLPWSAVDFGVRPVLVDGQAFDPHTPGAYPLMRRLWLQSTRPMPEADLQALQEALRYAPPPTVELVAVGGAIAQDDAGGLLANQGIRTLVAGADLGLGGMACGPANAAHAEALAAAGFGALSLAGGRGEACDATGLLAARELLQPAGVAAAGVGETALEAHRPGIVEVNGLRVALLAYQQAPPAAAQATETTPGVATLLDERLTGDIAAARDRADLVVVMPHWSPSAGAEAEAAQRETARALCGAGATLVLGQSSAVRGLAYASGCLAVLGMGGSGADGGPAAEGSEGLVVRALLDETGLKRVDLMPYRVVAGEPSLLAPEASEPILQEVARLTRELGGYLQEPETP